MADSVLILASRMVDVEQYLRVRRGLYVAGFEDEDLSRSYVVHDVSDAVGRSYDEVVLIEDYLAVVSEAALVHLQAHNGRTRDLIPVVNVIAGNIHPRCIERSDALWRRLRAEHAARHPLPDPQRGVIPNNESPRDRYNRNLAALHRRLEFARQRVRVAIEDDDDVVSVHASQATVIDCEREIQILMAEEQQRLERITYPPPPRIPDGPPTRAIQRSVYSNRERELRQLFLAAQTEGNFPLADRIWHELQELARRDLQSRHQPDMEVRFVRPRPNPGDEEF
jgi:hypothetical protein